MSERRWELFEEAGNAVLLKGSKEAKRLSSRAHLHPEGTVEEGHGHQTVFLFITTDPLYLLVKDEYAFLMPECSVLKVLQRSSDHRGPDSSHGKGFCSGITSKSD